MLKYEAPEMDVVLFAAENVIATSGLSFGGEDNGQSGSGNFEDLFPGWGQN
jgi:hypothetical protein